MRQFIPAAETHKDSRQQGTDVRRAAARGPLLILSDGGDHQDSYNIAADRAVTNCDIAHRFVVSYIHELPFGRGRRFWIQSAVDSKCVSGRLAGE
jgi:hypothetical protein